VRLVPGLRCSPSASEARAVPLKGIFSEGEAAQQVKRQEVQVLHAHRTAAPLGQPGEVWALQLWVSCWEQHWVSVHSRRRVPARTLALLLLGGGCSKGKKAEAGHKYRALEKV